MTITVKIAEAKARFSDLVARAEAGEEIVIARGNVPVARIAPLAPPAPRRPGLAAHWTSDPAWDGLNADLLGPLDAEDQAAADGALSDAVGIALPRPPRPPRPPGA